MCLMVQYLNNLDTDDSMIFTNLLALWLCWHTTGNPFRRRSLETKYRANIVCTAPCFKTRRRRRFCASWPTIRWETCYSKQLSSKCAYLKTLCLQLRGLTIRSDDIRIVIEHMTLKSVLRAGWSGTGSSALSAVHGCLHGVCDFRKNVHFEMMLSISHWR